MLSVNWEKIDKFYLVLIVVLALMAILVILSFRRVFSAYLTAYELDQNEIGSALKIDRDKLEEAHKWAFNKSTLSLEVRE